jgi:N6-adenosine-specific RNA methylase IME4
MQRSPEKSEFGVILVDPPWSYNRTSSSEKLSGYCDKEYELLTTQDLMSLPVADLGDDSSVLLLWCTWPFLPDGLKLIERWGFSFVTGMTWIKTTQNITALAYGVGYWFRGATELILVGKRQKAYRTNWLGLGQSQLPDGLVSPRLDHSRKPDSIYEVAESFPGPYLELFAREQRSGWYSLGNECPNDGQDIRQSLPGLVNTGVGWEKHYLAPIVSISHVEEDWDDDLPYMAI